MNMPMQTAKTQLNTRLTVEEIALLFSLRSDPESARNFLIAQIGRDLSPDEVRGRLKAAGRSLVAQNLLSIGDDASINMSPTMQAVAEILMAAEYTLRFDRTQSATTTRATFHRKNGVFYRHSVDKAQGIHTLQVADGRDEILRVGRDLFSLPFGQDPAGTASRIALNPGEIAGLGNFDGAQAALVSAGLPPDTAQAFAVDLAGADFRGDVLKVEYNNGTPTADQGFLILGGPLRRWMLTPRTVGEQVHTDIQTLDAATFEASVRALID